jgi:hypothetical protein
LSRLISFHKIDDLGAGCCVRSWRDGDRDLCLQSLHLTVATGRPNIATNARMKTVWKRFLPLRAIAQIGKLSRELEKRKLMAARFGFPAARSQKSSNSK